MLINTKTVYVSKKKKLFYFPITLDQIALKLSCSFLIRHYNPEILFSIGTAFLLIDPGDVAGGLEESGLTETIKTFAQVHRNSFLLLYAPFIGKKELGILSEIQNR